MVMQVAKFSPHLKYTQFGKHLYGRWIKYRDKPHSPEFDDFPRFYEWAIKAGYRDVGETLRRKDETLPYSPDNCYWVKANTICPDEWIEKWNETVNRIRRHYGMPPIGTSDKDPGLTD
jgi:hypothetical protein